jgi:hypothetical protein
LNKKITLLKLTVYIFFENCGGMPVGWTIGPKGFTCTAYCSKSKPGANPLKPLTSKNESTSTLYNVITCVDLAQIWSEY